MQSACPELSAVTSWGRALGYIFQERKWGVYGPVFAQTDYGGARETGSFIGYQPSCVGVPVIHSSLPSPCPQGVNCGTSKSQRSRVVHWWVFSSTLNDVWGTHVPRCEKVVLQCRKSKFSINSNQEREGVFDIRRLSAWRLLQHCHATSTACQLPWSMVVTIRAIFWILLAWWCPSFQKVVHFTSPSY